MKQPICCISYSPRAGEWLRTTTNAQIVHRFPNAINLTNEHQKVLSLVVPSVGNGPFAAVIDAQSMHGVAGEKEQAVVEDNRLIFGDNSISFDQARRWNPIPVWQDLVSLEKDRLIFVIEEQLSGLDGESGIAKVFYPNAGDGKRKSKFTEPLRNGSSLILEGLEEKDTEKITQGTAALAGLGVGLTPSGDDFLVGVVYGLWATGFSGRSGMLANLIWEEAAGRTTILSAAWLEAAGHAEAGESWHRLVQAVTADRGQEINQSIRAIIQTGETSGADALTGFVQVLKMEQR